MYKSINCGAARPEQIGRSLELAGWVGSRRDHGGLIFIDLRDRYGITQIVFDPQHDVESHKVAEEVRPEWVIQVSGELRARPEGTVNDKLATGGVELLVNKIVVLNRSLTPPFEIEDDLNTAEEIRLKYRFLDLRRPKMQANLRLRHRLTKMIWDYMDEHEFLNVETPLLLKSTPEGARDYVVPSRVHPGQFYALPQSPQQLKQILMAAGVERYFQIAKCLRDEDLRADRQPEHTQLDLEMSFAHQEDIMELVEGLYRTVTEALRDDIKLPGKFTRMTYTEAMRLYGTDKPDLRFGLQLADASSPMKACGAHIFDSGLAAGGAVKALVAPGLGSLTRSEMNVLIEVAQAAGAGGMVWIALGPESNPDDLTNENIKSSLPRFMTPPIVKELADLTKAQPGDLICIISGKESITNASLAALRNYLAERSNLADPNELNYLWVTDFPLFAWSDEEQRWDATHHLFSAPTPETLQYLESDPARVIGQQYDLVCNGVELGSGSIRIHTRALQEQVFGLIGYSKERVNSLFGHMLTAFDHGAPPHGGMGLGVDRWLAILTGQKSIRDVIAFPKTQSGIDLLFQAPDSITAEQLKELNIRLS